MALYFENLIVWQKAFLLAKNIYLCLKKFPREEQYVLIDQMKRSAISIVSNIAEGSGRGTGAEHKHFLHIAKGSCTELATQILLSKEFGYISEEEQKQLTGLLEEIVKMLYVMIQK